MKFNFKELKVNSEFFQRNDRTGRRFRKRYEKENGGTWTDVSGKWIHSSVKKPTPVPVAKTKVTKTSTWSK